MFVLGLGVESVAGSGSYLPFGVLLKRKTVSHIVIRSLHCLHSNTIQLYQLFAHVFLRCSTSLRCSKRKLRGTGLGAWLDLSERGVDVGVGEFYEVLIGIDLLFFLFRL